MMLPFHGTDGEMQWSPLAEKADRPQRQPEPSVSHHTGQSVQDAYRAHVLTDELYASHKSSSSRYSCKKHLRDLFLGHYA